MSTTEMKTRTLKEVCADVKVQWHRLGFNPETERTDWIASIGKERFEYHTGLKACLDEGVWRSLKTRFTNSASSHIWRAIESRNVKAIKMINDKSAMAIYEAISAASKPTAYDLIHCLKSDSDASQMSFEDWCWNCGYDTDSRKAFQIYELCQQNDAKLRRAVGNEVYRAIMEANDEI